MSGQSPVAGRRASRRAAPRRRLPSPTLVIGLLLVVLTAGALWLVRPPAPTSPVGAPTPAPLGSVSRGCPTAPPGAPAVRVSAGGSAPDGEVALRGGTEESSVPVTAGEVASTGSPGPTVVTATGPLAPLLLVARFGGGRDLAALSCPGPSPETWFAGVGTGGDRAAVLELVNPDAGPAVADVTVWARGGPVDVPRLLGLTVPGHGSTRLDLGELLPRRSELALRVVVPRGRLAASLLDEVPALGRTPATRDWIPAQTGPASDVLHLGLPAGRGVDVLTVANPGADEARVGLRVVTPDSEFTPEGSVEVTVPPGGLRTVTLTGALRAAVREDAIGLRVTSTVPVLSGLRSAVDDDLSHAAPVTAVGGPVAALVPAGTARLLLADAAVAGVVSIRAWDDAGRELEPDPARTEVARDQGAVVPLPRGTALVEVTPRRTTVLGAILVSGPAGATVVPLHPPPSGSLVPAVGPGWP